MINVKLIHAYISRTLTHDAVTK